jgi:hypothetical protein
MKFPIAFATLFLAATTALPAYARAPTGHSFYAHGGVARYTHDGLPARRRAVPQWQGYRNGYDAYAAEPRFRQPADNSWGHCVSGLPSEAYSGYPSWDVC